MRRLFSESSSANRTRVRKETRYLTNYFCSILGDRYGWETGMAPYEFTLSETLPVNRSNKPARHRKVTKDEPEATAEIDLGDRDSHFCLLDDQGILLSPNPPVDRKYRVEFSRRHFSH